ncbi:heme/hemin ABC transporter substrate-binding protein [Demequina aestuarii]|uniref:heme/hemin ABC transporter substrate-binding protein n=1 Tax=Demequina aestuarii TaxID=327095 RepID=UPI000781ADA9|nr:ABC transporter substrate-binding protein [Demequina aestuarii]
MGGHVRRRGIAAAALLLGLTLSASACTAAPTEPTASSAGHATGASAAPNAPAENHEPLVGIDPLDDPAAYVGPSTATLVSDAIVPVASPTPTLPTQVTSHSPDGTEPVEITDASRVVAMDIAGSIAATVWGLGLGDTLVGRDVAADFPGTEDIPVVTGSSHSVNIEAILALDPTVLITDGSIGPRRAVTQLADAGVAVVFVENTASFEGAAQLARDVAAIYGADDAGETLAQRILADVDATRDAITAIAPGEPMRMAFVYLRGSAGVYYLFGESAGTTALFEALGGIDAGAEAGIVGEQPMTDEAMLAMDPDVIFVMTSGIESVGGIDGLLASKPAIALTTAGQQRRFVDMDDAVVLSFGPRSAQVLEALAVATYAPDTAS